MLRAKETKFYLLGSILVVLLLFGSIELSTRVISFLIGKGFTLALHEFDAYDRPVTEIYNWHPFTGIILKPNNKLRGSHPHQNGYSQVKVDEHGFLTNGQRVHYQKPSDEIRLAFIGASTTANINLPYDENWPGRLGNRIQKVLPHKRVRVINAAVPGFDTAQSVGNLALRVLPFKPDIVIIYHAYNDLKAIRWALDEFKPDYSHIHGQPFGFIERPNWFMRTLNHSMAFVRIRNNLREEKKRNKLIENRQKMRTFQGRHDTIPEKARHSFEEHIRTLVYIARSGGAKVILSSFATFHDPHFEYNLSSSLAHLSDRQKSELISHLEFTPGLTLPAIFEGITTYNRVLRQIAIEENTGWVDNATLIPHTDANFVDRVHFTSDGAAQMADNFYPVIMQRLNS